MTFSNPIVAGEELVRSAIKSENFDSGVSGWRIARDGDAEFNDVTVRGELLVVGDSPPNEYIRIRQDLGVPAIEWSSENGSVWESYATDDDLKIGAPGGGIRILDTGETVLTEANLAAQGIFFDLATHFLSVMTNVSSATKEEWHLLTLANGWQIHDEWPEYRLMPDGTVLLRGNIRDGTTAGGTVFGTLPEGYRPLEVHRQITAEKQTGTSFRHIRVHTNGNLDVFNCTTARICLDGLRFPVI